MEFEKNEMANNDDFEQEARLYAEDQLQQAQAEIAAVKEQLQHQQQLLADANEERHVLKADAERQQHAWSQERAQLEQQLLEASKGHQAHMARFIFAYLVVSHSQTKTAVVADYQVLHCHV